MGERVRIGDFAKRILDAEREKYRDMGINLSYPQITDLVLGGNSQILERVIPRPGRIRVLRR